MCAARSTIYTAFPANGPANEHRKVFSNQCEICYRWGVLRLRRIETHPAASLTVRSIAHRMGLRFRLGGRGLPGEPHIVFPAHQTAIFVCRCDELGHGCAPKNWWAQSFPGSVRSQQDGLRRFTSTLQRRGWRVEIVWACETKSCDSLEARLRDLFGLPAAESEGH